MAFAFRSDEAKQSGFEDVISYLVSDSRYATEAEKTRSKEVLISIIEDLGPVVDSYPSWHPLVLNHNCRHPETYPSERCGYRGLDHTKYFLNGFITCPYPCGTKEVLESVSELPHHPLAYISAYQLNVQLYHPNATPILVKCEWNRPLLADGTIPLSIAMPLLLEKELPFWRSAEVAETWDTMRSYFLGRPCGSRSSLFVNQETGQAMKRIWKALIETGMYGPIKT